MTVLKWIAIIVLALLAVAIAPGFVALGLLAYVLGICFGRGFRRT